MNKGIVAGLGVVVAIASAIGGFAVVKPNEFNSLLKFGIHSQEDVYFDPSTIPSTERQLYTRAEEKLVPIIINDMENFDAKLDLLDPQAVAQLDPESLRPELNVLAETVPYQSAEILVSNPDGIDICLMYVKDNDDFQLSPSFKRHQSLASCSLAQDDIAIELLTLTEKEQVSIREYQERYVPGSTYDELIEATINELFRTIYVDVHAIMVEYEASRSSFADLVLNAGNYRKFMAQEDIGRQNQLSTLALMKLKELYEQGEINAYTPTIEAYKAVISHRHEFMPSLYDVFLLIQYGQENVNDGNFAREWVLERQPVIEYLQKTYE